MAEQRVISLIASATEIVAALGFEEQLVGRSHECDYPPTVQELPICTEAKLDVNGSSREIDERVKTILRDGVSVYRVFADELDRLRPHLLITQTQCEVCAVSLKDVEEAVCQLVSSQPQIVSLEPMELADVWKDIQSVADALDSSPRAGQLIADLQQRLESIEQKTAKLSRRPTIACIEWIDPLMAAGNWVPELVEIAGGVNLCGEAGKHSPWMSLDDLRVKDPDVIAILPCGFDMPRARREMDVLAAERDWLTLRAVREGQVYITDGNQYFNRPGPRLVESAEILAEIMHPSLFNFHHEGTGWERWPNGIER